MDWLKFPPLNALRAFAAAAEMRSLTKAAQLLNVTRPAISQQIRNLEDHLGEKLLLRGRRGVRLTSQGEVLANALASSFGHIGETIELLASSEESRTLHITTTPMFAASFLVPRLSDFREKHPGIELMLNPTSELLNLDRTGIDLAIRYGNGNWSGLKSELLFKGSFAIVAASSLIGKTKIRKPLDILNFPILMELGSTEFSDWLKRQGIDPSKHANITRMPGNLLLDGLRRGDGIVATVPRFIKRDLDAGRLTVLFEDRLDSGYYLLTRPGPHRAPQTKFVRWLRTAKSEN